MTHDADAPIPEKLSFKIGEVARLVGVKPHVLRFWEGEFAQIRPAKGRNGHRLYGPDEVATLRKLRTLLHDRGYTIAGARAVLRAGADAVDAAVLGQPSDAATALAAAEAKLAAAEAALAQAKAQTQAMHRVAARSREESEYWRQAAQRAERQLAALTAAVRREAEAMGATLATLAKSTQ